MKTFSLSVELSSLALETVSQPLAPGEFLSKVKSTLSSHFDVLGKYTGSRLNRRKELGADLRLTEYQLNYENSSLLFQLVRYNPRGEWQVQGFRFI
jgi:hypothetical protein